MVLFLLDLMDISKLICIPVAGLRFVVDPQDFRASPLKVDFSAAGLEHSSAMVFPSNLRSRHEVRVREMP